MMKITRIWQHMGYKRVSIEVDMPCARYVTLNNIGPDSYKAHDGIITQLSPRWNRFVMNLVAHRLSNDWLNDKLTRVEDDEKMFQQLLIGRDMTKITEEDIEEIKTMAEMMK